MEHGKKESSHTDKCSNCGNVNSSEYWDFDDGSMLCKNCYSEMGREWADKVYSHNEKTIPKKAVHQSAEKNQKTGARKYLMIGAAIIIGLILVFSAVNIIAGNFGESSQGNGSATSPLASGNTNGEVQNVKLALVDFSYKMTPNQVKVGVPVRMEVDASTLAGCMTTVVIKDFGVKKRITASDNIIEFTPTKTGTFWITCGMGMGPGSFEVVQSDGTADPNAAAAPPAPASTCGGGAGGGCGGGCGG